MIINPRGTSGSGKTFIVRELMKRYDTIVPVYSNNNDDVVQESGQFRLPKPRKQPYYYVLAGPQRVPAIVLGHYEGACGGCDTIPSLDLIFGLARQFAEREFDVIFEGLLVSAEHRRSDALFTDFEHCCIRLTTSMDDCVASIQARRAARGDERELNPRNTLLKDKAIISTTNKLVAAGHNIEFADRETALREALSVIGISS